MGTFTMKNIVQRNYGVNALKWQRTYHIDQESKKFDIGYTMNEKLKTIKKELNNINNK